MKYDHIGPLHRKLFYGGGMDKNVGHHGWKTVKNFKTTLAKRLQDSPQKRNLGQKVNNSKPLIWSWLRDSNRKSEIKN